MAKSSVVADSMKINRVKSGTNAAFNVLFALLAAMAILPVIFVFMISISSEESIRLVGYSFAPRGFSASAYAFLWNERATILQALFISVSVTCLGTLLGLALTTTMGYVLSRPVFKMKSFYTWVVFIPMIFNGGMVASYVVNANVLGLKNTIWALILPLMSTSFGVFLMGQFISAIPDDVLEAARIDGAGEKYSFFKIVLPMMRPAWMTLMILTFISSWNVTGAQFTYSESMKMLPTMMQQINTGGIIRTGVTAAVSVLLMLPPIVIFLFCENSVVETMAYSGIKS